MMAKGFFFIKSFMSDNCDMIIIKLHSVGCRSSAPPSDPIVEIVLVCGSGSNTINLTFHHHHRCHCHCHQRRHQQCLMAILNL